MGLLTQFLSGAVAGGAGAGATLIHENMQNAYKEERAKAEALRQENLARLKMEHDDARDDAKINPDVRVDGQVATNKDVREAIEANKKAKPAQDAVKARENANFEDIRDSGDLLRTDSIKDARTVSAPTEKEAGLIGSARKVTSAKEELSQEKLDTQKEIFGTKLAAQKELQDKKMEMTLQMAEMKYQNAKELLSLKQANGTNAEIQAARLELQKAEQARKSANSADALLKAAGGSTDGMTPEQLKSYNRHLKAAGLDDSVVPETVMTKENAEKQAKKDAVDAGETEGTIFKKPSKMATKIRAKELRTGGNSVSSQAEQAIAKVLASGLDWKQKQAKIAEITKRANTMQEAL